MFLKPTRKWHLIMRTKLNNSYAWKLLHKRSCFPYFEGLLNSLLGCDPSSISEFGITFWLFVPPRLIKEFAPLEEHQPDPLTSQKRKRNLTLIKRTLLIRSLPATSVGTIQCHCHVPYCKYTSTKLSRIQHSRMHNPTLWSKATSVAPAAQHKKLVDIFGHHSTNPCLGFCWTCIRSELKHFIFPIAYQQIEQRSLSSFFLIPET